MIYSSPKSFMRKIGLRLRSANDIRGLSEVEASHNSFRIAILGISNSCYTEAIEALNPWELH